MVEVLAWFFVGGCAAFPYRAPPGLDDANGAIVIAAAVKSGPQRARTGQVQLDIYAFASGCPDLSSRLTDRGYRGSVPLRHGKTSKIVLPGDEPVLLKGDWKNASQVCSSALVFRPRKGVTYLYGYASPSLDDVVCGAALKEVVDPQAATIQALPVRNVRSVRIRMSAWSGQTPAEDICPLASIRSDEPGATPIPDPLPEPEGGAEAARPRATAPSLPLAAAEVPPLRGEAPLEQRPSEPAMLATAPARRPRISGHSLGARIGFTAGGDTLATAQSSGGGERKVTGGGGGTLALDARITPLWWADTVGVGVGAELGRKGQQISASNGDFALNRYPLLATAHIVARVGEDSYLLLAGGVEKDLAASLSGSGAGDTGNLRVESGLGGVGSLTYAYALTPHVVFDGTLRFAVLHYVVSDPDGGSAQISASYGGFTLGAQYHF